MIIYFSATGNCKYVAQRISEEIGDRLISISDRMKSSDFELNLDENESIGFVTPTYFWGLPQIVTDFIEKLQIDKNASRYVYHVLTFGTTTGAAHKYMKNLLFKKGLTLQGKFAVRMVDTWTPMFDLSDSAENIEITKAADKLIDAVISKVKKKRIGNFNRNKGPLFIAKAVQGEYQINRSTSNFTLLDSCIGCGICENQCPVNAVKVVNGKAKWVKDKCEICLGCLHKCPEFAIQYRNKTQNHGQFVNPNVKI